MSRVQPVRLSALACALAWVVSGCSLLDLDDFGVEPCRRDSDCAAANEAEGIDAGAQCVAYQCNTENGLCELTKRDRDHDGSYDHELCEGSVPEHELDCADGDDARSPQRDDDCDERIDEDLWSDGAPLTGMVGTVDGLAYSVNEMGAAILALTREDGDTYPTYGLAATDRIDEMPKLLEDPDPSSKQGGCAPDGGCNFAQVALAAHGSQLFSIGIHRSSCIWGQVRVGVGEFSAGAIDLGLRTLPAGSEFANGVDPNDDANRCTHVPRACQGASRPAIAALRSAEGSDHRALALWLAPTGPGCADNALAVPSGPPFALVGLRLRRDPTTLALHSGDSEGAVAFPEPLTLDQTPAVIAFAADANGPDGYLIAHAGEGGPVLRHVAAIPTTSAALEAPRVGEIDDAAASHIALPALPAQNLDGLALAWRSRDGDSDVIRFAELSAKRTGASVTVTVVGEVLPLARATSIQEGPVLAYAPTGFGVSSPTGGWLVLWSEADLTGELRLMAVRVAQHEHAVLGAAKELARGELAHIIVYPRRANVRSDEDAVLRYGFVESGELRIAEATCRAR